MAKIISKVIVTLLSIIIVAALLSFNSLTAKAQLTLITNSPTYPLPSTQTPSLIPSQTPLLLATKTTQSPIVVILITLVPPTDTPFPTFIPTATPTNTATLTLTPTNTSTPTMTQTPMGPITTLISSPVFLIPAFLIIILLIVLYFISIMSKLSVIDIIKRWSKGQKLSLEIEKPVSTPENVINPQLDLGEEFDTNVWLSRPEFTFVKKYIDTIKSGNIAFAGPRGVGKTALMHAVIIDESNKMHVTLLMETPTRYDEKEFVLNLYEGLCRSVLERIKNDEQLINNWFPKTNYDESNSKKQKGNSTLLLAGIGGLVWALSQINTAATYLDNYLFGKTNTYTGFFIIGLVLLVLGVSIIFLMRSLSPIFRTSLVQRISEKSPELAYLYDQTQLRLERIRYEQTIESSSGAEFSLADILKLGSTNGRSLTRQPYTLVSLIADYREYIQIVTAQFSSVVIGIDELDKVQDEGQAREFLRKIKGVFSIKNTYYIVSVSEEALETFELRSIFGKDEVDSTFTTVIRLSSLTIKESKELLQLRNVNIPNIETLISVISGGLPRDLLRLARKIYLDESFGLLDNKGMIEKLILELFTEAEENIRQDKNIKDEDKLIINTLNVLMEKYGPLRIGSAMKYDRVGNMNKHVVFKSNELTNLLVRLTTRLEIMGFLGQHPEIFDDESLSSAFQNALSLISSSPLEAELIFSRLQTKFS